MHETTPSLLAAAREAGLEVLEAPLMVLDRGAWRAAGAAARHDGAGPRRRRPGARRRPRGAGRRLRAPRARRPGPRASRERDAAVDDGDLDFLRERMRAARHRDGRGRGRVGPVAAGAHQPVGDVTEIVGVATLPAVRRQGLGGAVTGALVEDALAHGVETVFLSAGSEEIARVYAPLGFRRVGTACIVG